MLEAFRADFSAWLWPGGSAIFAVLVTYVIYRLALAVFRHFSESGTVLRLFLDAPKRLISRAQMQESLGGVASESFDRAMDVRISRLRTKLGEDPKNPRLIKTIYGAGYIFLGDVSWG